MDELTQVFEDYYQGLLRYVIVSGVSFKPVTDEPPPEPDVVIQE